MARRRRGSSGLRRSPSPESQNDRDHAPSLQLCQCELRSPVARAADLAAARPGRVPDRGGYRRLFGCRDARRRRCFGDCGTVPRFRGSPVLCAGRRDRARFAGRDPALSGRTRPLRVAHSARGRAARHARREPDRPPVQRLRAVRAAPARPPHDGCPAVAPVPGHRDAGAPDGAASARPRGPVAAAHGRGRLRRDGARGPLGAAVRAGPRLSGGGHTLARRVAGLARRPWRRPAPGAASGRDPGAGARPRHIRCARDDRAPGARASPVRGDAAARRTSRAGCGADLVLRPGHHSAARIATTWPSPARAR